MAMTRKEINALNRATKANIKFGVARQKVLEKKRKDVEKLVIQKIRQERLRETELWMLFCQLDIIISERRRRK